MAFRYLICFVLLTILFAGSAYSQKYEMTRVNDSLYHIYVNDPESTSTPDHPFNTFYYNTEDKPDGKLLVMSLHGNILREAYYRSGKMGMDTWWFPGGIKEWEGDWQYINELKYYTRWYRTGSIESQTDPAGLNTHYYPNGNVKLQVQYMNGKKHGTYKAWYENGKLKEEGSYDSGLKLGLWKTYNEDGTLDKTTHYD